MADGVLATITSGVVVTDGSMVGTGEGAMMRYLHWLTMRMVHWYWLVDNADGALVDDGISIGGDDNEVLVLVSVGGGVVGSGTLALTVVPVRAGTCDWHAPLVVMPRVVISTSSRM